MPCMGEVAVPPQSLLLPLRGAKIDRLEGAVGGGFLLVGEQPGSNRILRVYLVWLWLLTEATLDSTGLQSSSSAMFKQTLTCRLHLHQPPTAPLRQTGSRWIEKHLWDAVSRGHVVYTTTISGFEAITITMTRFVH